MTSEPNSCDPGDIARLVKSSDDAAMERIARCYMDYLLGVGRCACRDPASAPDAVHDALVSAIQRLDQFRGDGSVKAWLSRMVVNACRCQERGRKNDVAWNQPLTDEPAGATPGPDQLAERSQLNERLQAAMNGLRSSDRELFLLSQVGDATAPELGAILGISPEAVRARLTRLRRRLRTELGDVWSEWD